MRTLIFTLLLIPSMLWSQVYVKNHQASFKVSENTTVKIPGHLKNENIQVFQNEGQITLTGNFSIIGENTSYLGKGKLIFQGISKQIISSTDSLAIAHLKVDNNALLTLATNITISNILDLNHNSIIALEDYDLKLNSQAQIMNYNKNSYVATNGTGSLAQEVGGSEIIFPVGNGSYNPAKIQNQGEVDNFSIRVEDGEPEVYDLNTSSEQPILNRTWYIHEQEQGGSDVILSLQWDEAHESEAFNREKTRLIFLKDGDWVVDSLFTNAQELHSEAWMQSSSDLEYFNNVAFLVEGETRTIENTLVIYPNPTTGLVTLIWEEYADETLNAILYNNQGQVFWVLEGSLDQINQQLNHTLSSSQKGMYLLRINNGLRDFSSKIILVK